MFSARLTAAHEASQEVVAKATELAKVFLMAFIRKHSIEYSQQHEASPVNPVSIITTFTMPFDTFIGRDNPQSLTGEPVAPQKGPIYLPPVGMTYRVTVPSGYVTVTVLGAADPDADAIADGASTDSLKFTRVPAESIPVGNPPFLVDLWRVDSLTGCGAAISPDNPDGSVQHLSDHVAMFTPASQLPSGGDPNTRAPTDTAQGSASSSHAQSGQAEQESSKGSNHLHSADQDIPVPVTAVPAVLSADSTATAEGSNLRLSSKVVPASMQDPEDKTGLIEASHSQSVNPGATSGASLPKPTNPIMQPQQDRKCILFGPVSPSVAASVQKGAVGSLRRVKDEDGSETDELILFQPQSALPAARVSSNEASENVSSTAHLKVRPDSSQDANVKHTVLHSSLCVKKLVCIYRCRI